MPHWGKMHEWKIIFELFDKILQCMFKTFISKGFKKPIFVVIVLMQWHVQPWYTRTEAVIIPDAEAFQIKMQ